MKRSREPDVDDLDSDSDSDTLGSHQVDLRPPVSKITELDPDAASEIQQDNAHQLDSASSSTAVMRCSLPPHKEPITFSKYGDFESHYNRFHTNRCLECRKNFPSDHLLSVHIEECHDPLVVVKRDNGEHTVSIKLTSCCNGKQLGVSTGLTFVLKQYSCFVEGCERKCLTHQKRRMHMIDKHMFPKNYFFAVTKEGIDGRRSLLIESGHRRRQSSTSTPTKSKDTRRRESLQESEKQPQQQSGPKAATSKPSNDGPDNHTKPDTEMEDLTGAMSSLQFVPPSIRFGRGRAGFPKR